jgi:aminoglycoside phosphotransferase family enzyme/predicted kinase
MDEGGCQTEEVGAEAEQKAIIDWLSGQLAERTPGGDIQRVVTHAAVVLLAGDRAYKIKRAVRYPYLDFSTPARRKNALERELVLNRRSAPALYRRVFSINRGSQGELLPIESASGSPVEWVLEMARFDREQELDRLATRGALGPEIIERLAISIAGFHKICETRPDMGGAAEMGRLVQLNTDQLAALAAYLGADKIAALDRSSVQMLARNQTLLERRRAAGFVRHCHGDLHLGNIVCIDGVPTLFDCIEFDDRIACIDTLYDLAFLLMDLLHCALPTPANRLLNGYLDALPYADYTDSLDGLALLPLFLSIRAAIRAHVEARRIGGISDAAGRQTVLAYMRLAEDTLRPPPRRLTAIGGLSGSGKSTLARLLAPHLGGPLGAVILRTDVLRKRMLGAPLTERLDESAYAPSISKKVYAEMMAHARRTLEAGHPVILDGVFLREEERTTVRGLAAALDLPFHGLWLTAPYGALATRLDQRKGDASDATRGVLDRQRAHETSALNWAPIETSAGIDNALRQARALIEAA